MVNIDINPALVLEKQYTVVKKKSADPNHGLKQGIWVYFLLLIFEGALRKWILPGLATPLLIIRDPVAVWLIIKCWQRGLLPSSIYLKAMALIGVISIFTAVFLGHGNLLVALYGVRPFLIHFPLVFVIGRIFNRDDVIRIGKATLWMTIPMTILIGMQFYSPQSAWVNRGVGGDMAGAGYIGAQGFFRPPATFSFTTGTTAFYSFAACYIFYFLFNIKQVNKLLLVAATISLFAAVPFSISRSLLYQIAVTFIFVLLAAFRKPENIGKILIAIAGATVVIMILGQISFLSKPIEAFTERFTTAGKNEGGMIKGTLGNRFTAGLTLAFTEAADKPYFGFGVGMGTKVGSMLLSGRTTVYLIAEDEWPRLIGEMGALMGMIVIFLRVGLTIKISLACYKRLAANDLLPWVLLSYGLLTLLEIGWSQPTYLGFYVMIGGLMFASLNPRESKNQLESSYKH